VEVAQPGEPGDCAMALGTIAAKTRTRMNPVKDTLCKRFMIFLDSV